MNEHSSTMSFKAVTVMLSAKGFVAVAPFPTLHAEKEVKHGFAMAAQKVNLQELEVVYRSEDGRFLPKDIVYVKAENYSHPYARQVYTVGETKFILIPESSVLLLNTNEQSYSTYATYE